MRGSASAKLGKTSHPKLRRPLQHCVRVWQMVVGVSWYQIVVRGEGVERTLLVALSLCIAAVPLALPLLFTATQVLRPST